MQINWFNESTPTATETNVSNIGIAFNWIYLLICSRLCQLNLNIFVLSLFRAPYNRNHFKKAMNEIKKIKSSKSHTLVKRLSDHGHPSRANGTVFCMPFPPKSTSVPFPKFFLICISGQLLQSSGQLTLLLLPLGFLFPRCRNSVRI